MNGEPADSFPRESARTQRFTLGEPRDVLVSPDGRRDRVPAQPIRDRSRELPVVARRRHRRGAPGRRSRGAAREQRSRRPAARGTGPARTYPRERRRDHRLRHRLGCHRRRLRPGGPAVRGGPASAASARELPVAGPVFDPRPDPSAARGLRRGRLLCIGELDGSWGCSPAVRTTSPTRDLGLRRVHRRRGDGPLPRVLVEPRRHAARGRPGSTPPGASAGTSPIRPTRRCRPTSRLPGGRHAERRRPLHVVGLDGSRGRRRLGPRALPVPRRRAVDRRTACSSPSSPATSAAVAVLDVDPGTGATTLRWRDTTTPGSSWCRRARLDRRRPLVTARRSRRRPPAARRRRAGHAAELQVRSVAAVDAAGVVFLANPLDDATVLHVWRWRADGALEASPTSRACTRAAAGGGDGRGAHRHARPSRPAQWATLDGVELVATPTVPPPAHRRRDLVARRSAPGDRRAAAARPRRLAASRCSSTRTAARTPSVSCRRQRPPDVAVVRRPGLRRRGRRRARHPGPRHRMGAGGAPRPRDAGARRPGRRAARRRRPSIPSSTSTGSRSAAGASAATSPRWPCCAGPTCSTPRSPAHRSPTGGSTTRTTPSAISATRTTQPDVYDASSLLPTADGLTRPLLLVHGLADDNVVAAHTLQLSSALLAAGAPTRCCRWSGSRT